MRSRLASTAFGLMILVLGANATLAKQFGRASYVKAGTPRPQAVVSADFDNDGNLDFACTDFYRGQVSVLLGNGNGTFQAPIKFSAPSAIGLAVGDFNNDGVLDLAVVEFGGTGNGALGIFLGTGHGHFHNSANYEVGIQPYTVAAGDFDGDGKLDVAVADSNQNAKHGDVRVFFGNGEGKVGKPRIYNVEGSPWSVAAGDLNGDKFPDLVVTQETIGSVAILLNDGTGKFGKPVSYDAGGGEVVDVKIADLRHDGMNDLAAVNASKNEVAILLNKGDGTFKAAQFYPTGVPHGGGVAALVIADFNLNGKLDIAAVNNFGDAALLYGNGNGTFQSAIPIRDGVGSNSAFSITDGDFDNDGSPDLAIPIEIIGKPRGRVAILLNAK